MNKQMLLSLLLLLPTIIQTTFVASAQGLGIDTVIQLNDNNNGVYENLNWKIEAEGTSDGNIELNILYRSSLESCWEIISNSVVQAPGTLEFTTANNTLIVTISPE